MRAVNSNKNILHTQLAANSFVQHLMTTNEFVIRMCLYKFEYEYFVRKIVCSTKTNKTLCTLENLCVWKKEWRSVAKLSFEFNK